MRSHDLASDRDWADRDRVDRDRVDPDRVDPDRADREPAGSGPDEAHAVVTEDAGQHGSDGTAASHLAPLRARIDDLDRAIVRLLNERARVGLEIGRAKHEAGVRIHDPRREDEVLRRVAAANEGPVPEEDLLALYRAIVALTRRLEGDQNDVDDAS